MSDRQKEVLKEKMKAESFLGDINDKMMAYISVHTLEETVVNICGPMMDKVQSDNRKTKELAKLVDGFYEETSEVRKICNLLKKEQKEFLSTKNDWERFKTEFFELESRFSSSDEKYKYNMESIKSEAEFLKARVDELR